MVQSSFLFANATTKRAKLISRIAFAVYILTKPYWTGIKILLTLQEVVSIYAGNLIYSVRLQVNLRDRLAK